MSLVKVKYNTLYCKIYIVSRYLLFFNVHHIEIIIVLCPDNSPVTGDTTTE